MYPPYHHHAQNVYTEQKTQNKNSELAVSMPRKHTLKHFLVSRKAWQAADVSVNKACSRTETS